MTLPNYQQITWTVDKVNLNVWTYTSTLSRRAKTVKIGTQDSRKQGAHNITPRSIVLDFRNFVI